MEQSKRIAFIGELDTVLPFQPLDVDVFPLDTGEEVAEKLDELVKSGKYGIIFVTENFHEDIEEIQAEIAYQPIPTVVLVPEIRGSRELGVEALRETITRAIGRDIMKDEE